MNARRWPKARTLLAASLTLSLAVSARSALAEEPPAADPTLPSLPAPATSSTDPMAEVAAPPATHSPSTPAPSVKTESPPVNSTNGQSNPPAKPKAITVLRLGAGYDWHSYYGIPFRGADLSLGVGGETGHFGGYGGVGVTFASSPEGLSSRKLRLVGGLDYNYGRFRLGLEGFLAYLNVDRVTLADDNFEVMTFGIAGLASFDVVRTGDRGAFFVQAKISGDLFAGGGDQSIGTAWGPTFSLGFRY